MPKLMKCLVDEDEVDEDQLFLINIIADEISPW